MKLLLINGSPRGKASNSRILAGKFLEGFKNKHDSEIVDLRKEIDSISKLAERLSDFTHIIMVFPLYTDSMPAIVKRLIEEIGNSKIDLSGLEIGYIVQSGFPESYQSEFLEKYLKKLTSRIKAKYLGTIIKGGVEGIKIQPEWMTRKLFNNFRELGRIFAETGEFDKIVKNTLADPRLFSKRRLRIFGLLQKTGLTNFYWNSQLKKNKVFENELLLLQKNKPNWSKIG